MEKPNDSLKAAIFNAYETAGVKVSANLVDLIELHVKDFLAQKFQLFMLPPGSTPTQRDLTSNATAELLWMKIIGKTKRYDK